MNLKNVDIVDLLHGTGTEALRDTGLEITSPMLERNSPGTTFSFRMHFLPTYIDKYEVSKHQNSPTGFMLMLSKKMFARVSFAYRHMVDVWGMPPIYYIEPIRDQDYLDGFVA